MEMFVIWLAGSVVAAVIAEKKGRNAVGFFCLSALLSPLIGIIAALVASPDAEEVERRTIAIGRGKRCLYCAEIIKREAKVCRFCSKDQPADMGTVPAAAAKSEGSWAKEEPEERGKEKNKKKGTRVWRKELQKKLPTKLEISARTTAITVFWGLTIAVLVMVAADRNFQSWLASKVDFTELLPALFSTEDTLAAIVHRSGHPCSIIVGMRQSENQETYEVTCEVESRFGGGRRGYLVSLKTRTAILASR